MHVGTRVLQSGDGLGCAVHERGNVALPQSLDRGARGANDLETPPVHFDERNLAVHGRLREPHDLRIAAGQHVDAFDRDQRRVDVEEDESVLRATHAWRLYLHWYNASPVERWA
jgi:hypothetical protein